VLSKEALDMTTTRNTITDDVTLADIEAACSRIMDDNDLSGMASQLNAHAVWTHRHETGTNDNEGLIPADDLAGRYVFAAFMSSDERLWITTATILAQCIEDIKTIETAGGPICVYVDTSLGGLSWDRWSSKLGYWESGALGPDRGDYEAAGYSSCHHVDDDAAYRITLDDVVAGLRAAGVEVAT